MFGINDIKNIPLFAGLDATILQEIVDHGQVNMLHKGDIILSQEEEIIYFYLIVKGGVRSFISDVDGDETTLQLIDGGDFVNDVFNDKAQFTVQAVQDSEVLAVPLNKMRDIVNQQMVLASNFNAQMAVRNRRLIDQLASLRLCDSKEKVGKFLLGKAFGKDGQKGDDVELKYSKAVVASYLGLNPETLSRAFKKLKEDGEIAIEKNKVKLLKEDSLCDYCDEETGGKCQNRDADFCKFDEF